MSDSYQFLNIKIAYQYGSFDEVVKLAVNESYREEIKAKILNHQEQIFNDVKPLDILAEKLKIILSSSNINVN